jgi:hypothetical protein
MGMREFQVFLIHESKVFLVSYAPTFLHAFDPKNCLYLYEPGKDKSNEPGSVEMKSVATVSPNRIVSKSTPKGRMPTWELDELKQIGAYLANQPPKITFTLKGESER